VNDTHVWRTIRNLIPLLFFLSACLILLFINPCSWLLGDPLFAEYCWLDVDNQSSKTLHVTPICTDHSSYSAVRIYRTTFPISPAYQQRNIMVKSGDQVFLAHDCSQGVSELYACGPEGECYVRQSVYHHYPNQGSAVPYERFTFTSLESLSRPDTALEAAVQSFPEHNYSGMKDVLLCFVQIMLLLGGLYWLIRARTGEIPIIDI
jgi:hypothetical protein